MPQFVCLSEMIPTASMGFSWGWITTNSCACSSVTASCGCHLHIKLWVLLFLLQCHVLPQTLELNTPPRCPCPLEKADHLCTPQSSPSEAEGSSSSTRVSWAWICGLVFLPTGAGGQVVCLLPKQVLCWLDYEVRHYSLRGLEGAWGHFPGELLLLLLLKSGRLSLLLVGRPELCWDDCFCQGVRDTRHSYWQNSCTRGILWEGMQAFWEIQMKVNLGRRWPEVSDIYIM